MLPSFLTPHLVVGSTELDYRPCKSWKKSMFARRGSEERKLGASGRSWGGRDRSVLSTLLTKSDCCSPVVAKSARGRRRTLNPRGWKGGVHGLSGRASVRSGKEDMVRVSAP